MIAKDFAVLAPTGAVSDEAHDSGAAAWAALQLWHAQGTVLSFVYARAGGGLMQTGTLGIARLDTQAISLASSDCKLAVLLAGATFKLGPQLFFTPDFGSRFNVDGVAIALANHDWLFLTASAPGSALTLGTISIGVG